MEDKGGGYSGSEYGVSPDRVSLCCQDRSGGRDRPASSLSDEVMSITKHEITDLFSNLVTFMPPLLIHGGLQGRFLS